MPQYERYTHRWSNDKSCEVGVRSDLKGKHREHCLCYAPCIMFRPGIPENCVIAQRLYEFDAKWNVVTPVWECSIFVLDPYRDESPPVAK